jgi:CRISPR-associated endonuclease/helicase Cas3
VEKEEAKVYSHPDFPSSLKPLAHQLLTLEIIRNYFTGQKYAECKLTEDFNQYYREKIPLVLVNIAGTGQGKTLAASAPIFTLKDNLDSVIFSYPTNELIHDQKQTIHGYIESFNAEHEVIEVNRPTLLQLREESPIRFKNQGAMWEHILSSFKKKIICTNPDILYYSLIERYAGTIVAQIIMQAYPIIVYDEFHLCNSKQISDALIAIALAKAFRKPKIFIFLSATPNDLFINKVKSIEVPVIPIQSLQDRIKAKPESMKLLLVGEVELEVYPYPSGIWSALECIEQHIADVQSYLKSHPSEKIVAILDSVYEAKCLAEIFERTLGLEVGQCHGWMNVKERHEEIKKQVVVGSSAIEVGIDFKCSFLIFEAKNWDTFMQRLGRVARKGITYGKAIAIVPKLVFQNLCHALSQKRTVNRGELSEHIKEAFHSFEDFQSYTQSWLGVEAKIIFDEYISTLTRDEREEYKNFLYQILCKLTEKDLVEINQLVDEARNLEKGQSNSIFKVLTSYRETEPQLAIYDHEDKTKGWFPFKFYDMNFVLRRCNFSCISSLKEFLSEHKSDSRSQTFMTDLEEMEKWGNLVAQVQVYSTTVKPNIFTYTVDSENFEKINCQLGIADGFGLKLHKTSLKHEAYRNFFILSKKLRSRKMVAFAYPRPPVYVSEEFDLPPLFRVYPLELAFQPTKNPLSVSFGLNAVMLDSLRRVGKLKIE